MGFYRNYLNIVFAKRDFELQRFCCLVFCFTKLKAWHHICVFAQICLFGKLPCIYSFPGPPTLPSFAAFINICLEYRARPPTDKAMQWCALINSQGVYVVKAGGGIKRLSELALDRGGIGGQRGADVGLAYSSSLGRQPLDLPHRSLSSLSFLSVSSMGRNPWPGASLALISWGLFWFLVLSVFWCQRLGMQIPTHRLGSTLSIVSTLFTLWHFSPM